MAAVAAAVCHDAAGIELRLRGDPVEKRVDVLVRVVAQHAVVELEESLTVAAGAADVGLQEGDAQDIDPVVIAPNVVGPGLPFGAAVDINDDGTLPGEFHRIGLVEESTECETVEALPSDQRWLDEVCRIESAGFPFGPALELAVIDVDRVDIAGYSGRGHRKPEFMTRGVKRNAPDDSRGHPGERAQRAGGGVEDIELVVAVLVGDDGDELTVLARRHLIHIPRNRGGQI